MFRDPTWSFRAGPRFSAGPRVRARAKARRSLDIETWGMRVPMTVTRYRGKAKGW